jgi:hypothetical protein
MGGALGRACERFFGLLYAPPLLPPDNHLPAIPPYPFLLRY